MRAFADPQSRALVDLRSIDTTVAVSLRPSPIRPTRSAVNERSNRTLECELVRCTRLKNY